MFNYYVAHIGITSCVADISLNDVPLFFGCVDGYHAFSLPINPFISFQGLQTLMVKMLPSTTNMKPTSGKIWIEISLYDGSGARLEKVDTVSEIVMRTDGSSILSSIKMESKHFEASISNPVKRWEECQKIDEGRDLRSSVMTYYNRIQKILQRKEYSVYTSLIADREKQVVQSLGLGQNEIDKRQRMLENELSDMKPVQLQGNEVLHYFCGGKIMALYTPTMEPALRFENDEDYLSIDLFVGIKKGESTFSII